MAIYITGDTHGDIDLGKLKREGFAAQKGDYVIICGDFGAVWDDSKEDKDLQKHDMALRIPGKDWWAEEMPSYREVKEGYKNLIKNNKEVDYIITHCAPTYVVHLINPWYKGDGLTEFFEGISFDTEFKHWYCGHYHMDADFINNISVLYDRIIKL